MAIGTCTFLGRGLILDHEITSPNNGMLVHQNRHLSLLNFRLDCLHILRTLSSVASWSLLMSSNPAMRVSSTKPKHLATPGIAFLFFFFFFEKYLQPAPYQMAAVCICTYKKEKVVSMMTVRVALSCGTRTCVNDHEVFNTCQSG